MLKTSWEILIKRCPHCNSKLHIHHRSTIGERHLMEMVYKDLNFHSGNQCIDDFNPKVLNIVMETESITKSSGIRLYKGEDRKLVF